MIFFFFFHTHKIFFCVCIYVCIHFIYFIDFPSLELLCVYVITAASVWCLLCLRILDVHWASACTFETIFRFSFEFFPHTHTHTHIHIRTTHVSFSALSKILSMTDMRNHKHGHFPFNFYENVFIIWLQVHLLANVYREISHTHTHTYTYKHFCRQISGLSLTAGLVGRSENLFWSICIDKRI